MKSKLTFLLGLVASATMVSCYPPPAPPKPNQPIVKEPQEKVRKDDPTDTSVSANAHKELRSAREETDIRPIDEAPTASDTTSKPRETIKQTVPSQPTIKESPVVPPVVDTKPKSFPFATPVPNKPGFVFNPYTQSKVDVRGLPSGTLVSDPRNAAQKFYVP